MNGSTALETAALWRDFFAVPFVQAGFSDNALAALLQSLTTAAFEDYTTTGGVTPSTIAAVAAAQSQVGSSAIPLRAVAVEAVRLAAYVPPGRRAFYTGHAVLQTRLLSSGTAAVLNLCAAVGQLASSNASAALLLLRGAVANMDDVFAAQRDAEYGQWHGSVRVLHVGCFCMLTCCCKSLFRWSCPAFM